MPNLGLLREYKPLMAEFWRDGLFGGLDERYFRLVDRSTDMAEEVDWRQLDKRRVFEAFRAIFNNQNNVQKEAYFDKMTHFDFKCLLPALLQVEDRMSMAHGLESRVPLLDHPLIEFLATVPADVKFAGGRMKHLLKLAYGDELPVEIAERRDKMGFPVPLKEWFSGELNDLVQDIFRSRSARTAAVPQHRCGAGKPRQRRTVFAQAVGPAEPRIVASDVPRPRRRIPPNAGAGAWRLHPRRGCQVVRGLARQTRFRDIFSGADAPQSHHPVGGPRIDGHLPRLVRLGCALTESG